MAMVQVFRLSGGDDDGSGCRQNTSNTQAEDCANFTEGDNKRSKKALHPAPNGGYPNPFALVLAS